jgi:uncharacterized protein DUF4267
MFLRVKMDRKARQVALAIGASRVAIGLGILLATRSALRALGFGAPNPGGEALARLGGGRDVAIGALTLAARNDRQALRHALLVSSACDLADAIALGVSGRHPETRKAGIGGVLSGGIAAAAGLWAWRRLGN